MRHLYFLLVMVVSVASYGAVTFEGAYDTAEHAKAAMKTAADAVTPNIYNNGYWGEGRCSGQPSQYPVVMYAFYWYLGAEEHYYCYGAPCPEGTEIDVTTGQCKEESKCKSGEDGVGTWYEGIASSPTWKPPSLLPTGVMCDGECQIEYIDGDVDVCLYAAGKPFPKPLWCSFKGTKNGKTCTYGDQTLGNGGIAPDDVGAVCPNGNCTPSPGSSGSTQNTDNTSNAGSDGGSKTCANGATDYPTCTAPRGTSNGNPTTGTTTSITGTVSLDEGGSATGVDRGAGSADLEAQTKERKDAFTDQTKVGELPWKFVYSLPSNYCHTLKFGVFGREREFDVCPWLSMLREGLGYLIYFLTSLYIWRSLTGSVGASGAK